MGPIIGPKNSLEKSLSWSPGPWRGHNMGNNFTYVSIGKFFKNLLLNNY
jgi:hypothetical protein